MEHKNIFVLWLLILGGCNTVVRQNATLNSRYAHANSRFAANPVHVSCTSSVSPSMRSGLFITTSRSVVASVVKAIKTIFKTISAIVADHTVNAVESANTSCSAACPYSCASFSCVLLENARVASAATFRNLVDTRTAAVRAIVSARDSRTYASKTLEALDMPINPARLYATRDGWHNTARAYGSDAYNAFADARAAANRVAAGADRLARASRFGPPHIDTRVVRAIAAYADVAAAYAYAANSFVRAARAAVESPSMDLFDILNHLEELVPRDITPTIRAASLSYAHTAVAYFKAADILAAGTAPACRIANNAFQAARKACTN